MTASSAEKTYICPGCSTAVLPGVAHLVVWSEDHLFGAAAGLAERRHWHTNCWTSAATAIAKLVSMTFDPGVVRLQPALCAHRHPRFHGPSGPPRERGTPHLGRSRAGGRARRPGIRRDQGNTHHAAPAADARRLHGFARLPQGVLPAARAGRNRRPALQHARARHRRGAPAGEPSRRASASGSTSRPRCSSPWTAACPTAGWWAGPSAPSWR